MSEPQKPKNTETILQCPIGPDVWIQLKGSFPIKQNEWDILINLLNAMKPGIVEPE